MMGRLVHCTESQYLRKTIFIVKDCLVSDILVGDTNCKLHFICIVLISPACPGCPTSYPMVSGIGSRPPRPYEDKWKEMDGCIVLINANF